MPCFADSLVGREAFEGLEPSAEVVSGAEVAEMLSKLVVAFVVVSFDGRVLDSAVHPLDLTVGPGVLWFGEPVVDVVLRAGELERVGAEELAVGDGLLDQRDGRAAGTGRGKVDAIIGQ